MLDLIILIRLMMKKRIYRKGGINMDANAKIKLLESRLQTITARGKDCQGVCRRIQRDIRNLKKQL